MATPYGNIDEPTVIKLLLQAGTQEAKEVAKNPKYVKAIVKQLKYINDMMNAKGGPQRVAALISSVDNGYATGTAGSKDKTVRISAFAASQLAKTLSLMKMASNVSPGRAMATVGIAFSEKVVLAAGLAAESDRAKCYSALASVALSVGATALTGLSGVGGVLGMMAVASYSYEAYETCRAH